MLCFFEIHGHDKKYKTCNQVVETNEVIRGHLSVLGVKTTREIALIRQK